MQSGVNLSMLALPCSRIPLVKGGVYYVPCGGWALVCKKHIKFNKVKYIILVYIYYVCVCVGGVLVLVYC